MKTIVIDDELSCDLKTLKGLYKLHNLSQVIREMMKRLSYNDEFFDRVAGLVG